MADFSSFSNVRIVSGTLTIPIVGAWTADIALATTDAVQPTADLVIGNLTLRGTAFRQTAFAGQRNCRLVGGHAGWLRVLSSQYYAMQSGVRLSMVLGDAARAVGEQLNVPNDRILGTSYTREADFASTLLRRLAVQGWYIDPAGVTQIAQWPARNVTPELTLIQQDGGTGRVEVATEDYASFLPNSTFTAPTLDAPVTCRGITYNFAADGKLRLEVLT